MGGVGVGWLWGVEVEVEANQNVGDIKDKGIRVNVPLHFVFLRPLGVYKIELCRY